MELNPGERQFYVYASAAGYAIKVTHWRRGGQEKKSFLPDCMQNSAERFTDGENHREKRYIMENEKKDNTLRSVLLIFAVIFSIIFVPALFVFVPAGAVVTTLSGMASLDSIEKVVEEAEVSKGLYEIAMKEAFDENTAEIIGSEEGERILRDSFTDKDMNQIFLAFLRSAYYGTNEKIDLSGIADRLKKNFNAFYESIFDEGYAAWRNGTVSTHFSEEFCRSFYEAIEKQLLEEYADYGAVSFAELEEKYDAVYGSGAFSKVLEKRVASIREEWGQEMREAIESQTGEIIAETEVVLQNAMQEMAHDPDVRKVFDVVQPVSDMNKIIGLVVYAVILGMVIILILLYWVDIPGFIVCAVPVFFGGAVCKGIGLAEKIVMRYVDEEILSESAGVVQYEDMFRRVMHEIIAPFFKGVSDFGTKAIIFSVILIGCAILRGVIKKNKREAEQSYS